MIKRITAIACVTTLVFVVAWLFARASSSGQGSIGPAPVLAPSFTPESAVNELSDSTVDWETYKEDFYDFSIKYPPTWSYSYDSAVPRQDRTLFFFDDRRVKSQQQAYLPWEGISVRVVNNEASLSLLEMAAGLYTEATGGIPPNDDVLTWNFLEINEYPALKASGIPSCCSEYLVLVSFEDSTKVLVFSLDSGFKPLAPNEKSEYEDVLFAMLKSLQF